MNWIDARKVEDWVPLVDCVHGALYRIASRNLLIGIYSTSHLGFIGVRVKFDEKFLFVENHWDSGEPCGTAKPLEMIEMWDYEDVSDGYWHEGEWVCNIAMMEWLEERL